MRYRALAETLVPVAEAVRKHFMKTEGAKRFRAEEEVAPSLLYRPTLVGESQDLSIIAIEVNEGTYTSPLDEFVLECLRQGIAIRLFVAAREGGPDTEKMNLVRKAKSRGIGVLEVRGSIVTPLLPALSLSLIGLRPIDRKQFPKQSHSQLTKAEETFHNGDPVKACGRIYDLVENWSRAVALEIDHLGLWQSLPQGQTRPKINLKDGSWTKVLEFVDEHAAFGQLRKNGLSITKPLWGRLRGLTPHRNESGHEPRTREELQTRNTQLRTRFEHAVDTFGDLARASPHIHI
jgi:hypothetical protein